MFLSGLKDKSILRKLKEVNRIRHFKVSSKPISSICILQHETAVFDQNQLAQLLKALSVKESQVAILTFAKAIKKEDKSRTDLVTSKHIGWKAVLKPTFLKEWQNKPYDLLLSYYTDEILALHALTSLSHAKFKVGITPAFSDINDLTISVSIGEEALLIKELNKYIQILKIGA